MMNAGKEAGATLQMARQAMLRIGALPGVMKLARSPVFQIIHFKVSSVTKEGKSTGIDTLPNS